MKIYNSILELIGSTPLIAPSRIVKGSVANIFLKLEYFNPGGSVKDRAAHNMVKEAENCGLLKPGATIVEATSGNTGIALATIAAAKGYKLILVIPDCMSVDKINRVKSLGAEVVLTSGILGMKKAFREAEKIVNSIPGAFMPHQITNPANPDIHEKTTGMEIWEDLDGKIDIFIAGVGTGGTITGTSRYLKKKKPDIHIIAIEPDGSAVLSGESRGPHKIQGVGAGFIPEILDRSVIDEIYRIKDDDAMQAARNLAVYEGIFTGISSGAAFHTALEIGKRKENAGKNIVAILPDGGERYLSTELYNPDIKESVVT